MLKAVLFDMDDTLLDWSQRTIEWSEYERQHLELVFNYVSRDVHPLRVPDVFYDAARHFTRLAWTEAGRGKPAPNLGTVLGQALEWIGVPPEVIDVDACLRAYDWQLVSGVVAFPDVPEVLPVLAGTGLKIGLVTNAYQPMWMRDRELDACGILLHFTDCRISAADVGYLKPHPAIFELALSKLNLTPDEVVFVGDNPESDIAGAQNVGMRAVLRVRQIGGVLGNIVPDGEIETLHDLLTLLDTWYPGWRS